MTDLIIQNHIKDKIYTIRGLQVMIDMDLAELYKVKIKRLNEQVKRNKQRFPENFMFQLTDVECQSLRSQNATLEKDSLRFQNGTLESKKGKHRKYLPYVFTEQGVAMLSAVLRSDIAVYTSIQIINAFVEMRKFIFSNAQIFQRLGTIETKQIEHKLDCDNKFNKIFKAIEDKQIKPNKGIFFDGQIFDVIEIINF